MNKNHEQIHKEYMTKNAPFFGVFGHENKSKFFAILDSNLSPLFITDKVFDRKEDLK